jgi:hypothetical protein
MPPPIMTTSAEDLTAEVELLTHSSPALGKTAAIPTKDPSNTALGTVSTVATATPFLSSPAGETTISPRRTQALGLAPGTSYQHRNQRRYQLRRVPIIRRVPIRCRTGVGQQPFRYRGGVQRNGFLCVCPHGHTGARLYGNCLAPA